jgi:hypothetical protein
MAHNVRGKLIFIKHELKNTSKISSIKLGFKFNCGLLSQVFPINMKGSAGSIVSLVNWFSSWIVSYVFNFLMEWSSAGDASFSPLSSANFSDQFIA